MSHHSPQKNNNPNNNNINTVSSNPLNFSSTTFQRRGVRRRWENIRRSNQSVENISRGNNNINNNNNNNERINLGRSSDLNLVNINSNNNNNNNLGRNSNVDSNEINSNIIHNHNNYNIVNNFNNYDIRGNSINADSCFVQFRRIRKNYLDKQNFLNNINNNDINQITNIQTNNNSNDNNINQISNIQSINNANENNRSNNVNQINNINDTGTSPINIINNNNENNNIINTNNEINTNIENNQEEKLKNEIKEEPKEKPEEISKEESIGSEIKDTVKCYICFEKINKPKMCPHCHRMACEKCLHNWFINLKKDKCGFCRSNSNFNEMISVPFMDVVVNFVEKFFTKKKVELNLTDIDKDFLEYCPEHENELLYYYCLDCGKAYCKTCFVFFGAEKDKHNSHSIIEYEKYKNMSFPLLKKNLDKLESNIQHVEENIKRCISYKNSYEHQRKVGNEFINNLQDAFNNQMDTIITSIDDHIKKLKEYINEYNKYKKDIDEFYSVLKNKKANSHPDKSCESLIIKLTNINQHKFFSSKDIEKLSDLSKNFYVNTYQSKIGEFNHENIFLSRGLKMGNSNCELMIDNKQRDEVVISLNIPKNKFHGVHNFKGMIFIRKKGECLQSYDLDEYSEDYNFFRLKKKIPWDFIGSSIFKLKGILYDFYFS